MDLILTLTLRYETVGVDSRKAVADGYPLKNIITVDLHQGKSDMVA